MTGSDPLKDKKKALKDYARYSGMGFQMLGTILAGVLIGRKLDQWLKTAYPVFTLVFVLASVGLAMYVVIREVTGKKNK
jgi:ATP synthase protein I